MKTILLGVLPNLWDGVEKCENAAQIGATECTQNLSDLTRLAVNVSKIAITLVATVALMFFIIGGFLYVTSAGNPDQIGKAKATLTYATIGLLVVILGFSITTFVLDIPW
jgi:hypothetical protein